MEPPAEQPTLAQHKSLKDKVGVLKTKVRVVKKDLKAANKKIVELTEKIDTLEGRMNEARMGQQRSFNELKRELKSKLFNIEALLRTFRSVIGISQSGSEEEMISNSESD